MDLPKLCKSHELWMQTAGASSFDSGKICNIVVGKRRTTNKADLSSMQSLVLVVISIHDVLIQINEYGYEDLICLPRFGSPRRH